jgi:hypothetical protein
MPLESTPLSLAATIPQNHVLKVTTSDEVIQSHKTAEVEVFHNILLNAGRRIRICTNNDGTGSPKNLLPLRIRNTVSYLRIQPRPQH